MNLYAFKIFDPEYINPYIILIQSPNKLLARDTLESLYSIESTFVSDEIIDLGNIWDFTDALILLNRG